MHILLADRYSRIGECETVTRVVNPYGYLLDVKWAFVALVGDAAAETLIASVDVIDG